jgi:hypothetical protein
MSGTKVFLSGYIAYKRLGLALGIPDHLEMTSSFTAKDAKRMRESVCTFVQWEDDCMSLADLYAIGCKRAKNHDSVMSIQLDKIERKIEALESLMFRLLHA